MSERIIRQYLRDKKGNPVGCMVGLLDDGKLLIGVSKHAEKREPAPFTKQGAYDRAMYKALGGHPLYKEWYVPSGKNVLGFPFSTINFKSDFRPTFPASRRLEVETFILKCCERFSVEECANYKKVMAN